MITLCIKITDDLRFGAKARKKRVTFKKNSVRDSFIISPSIAEHTPPVSYTQENIMGFIDVAK